MEQHYKELDQIINELRNAASAVLLIFEYKKREPKKKKILRDLSETSISEKKYLLKQYHRNLKDVFTNKDPHPDEIKKLMKDIQNEVIIPDPENIPARGKCLKLL